LTDDARTKAFAMLVIDKGVEHEDSKNREIMTTHDTDDESGTEMPNYAQEMYQLQRNNISLQVF
jgi:hypothetical protein